MSEAISRYHTAKGYFQSAIMICRSPERNTEARRLLTHLSMCMLLAFSLELYFKAWLLSNNMPTKQVRAYGHRVRDLYAEASSQGMPSILLLEDLVISLGKGHEDFTFRYMDECDSVPNINWEIAFSVLDALDNEVDSKSGASASRGLLPGH